MNIFKSHFWYNKHQRNGILFLLGLIGAIQLIKGFVSNDVSLKNYNQDIQVQRTIALIDSLKAVEVERRKPKIYPFNPNFITDFKGEQLGMSLKEIDRLHAFRKTNKFVNSTREFQRVTRISDSLLNKISPFFKFPDWVIERNKQNQKQFKKQQNISLNTAKESNDYKESSKEKETIIKLNVNTATFKEILKIPGIDYELCKKIFEFRDEVAELQDISELKNIEGFPLEKYDRIIVYLTAE